MAYLLTFVIGLVLGGAGMFIYLAYEEKLNL